jgi:hypothetical protein
MQSREDELHGTYIKIRKVDEPSDFVISEVGQDAEADLGACLFPGATELSKLFTRSSERICKIFQQCRLHSNDRRQASIDIYPRMRSREFETRPHNMYIFVSITLAFAILPDW